MTVKTHTMSQEGARLHFADRAHTRLLMDADAEHMLARTGYDELRSIAERHSTLGVPQVQAALAWLQVRQQVN